MTGTRLGQVPIVASWMQYESETNWGRGSGSLVAHPIHRCR